ncbi:hypothetical protein LY85_0141 [Clostridium sp. KNHs216]|nr:hypothetical protein LY85_0141 [Clostridium sp. KNHs216]
MTLNIIIGFIIPWITALIFIRERKVLFLIAPFSAAMAFLINDIGFLYYWKLYPFYLDSLASLPFTLGLFCLYPCFAIYLIRKYHFPDHAVLILSSLLLTLAEGCGFLSKRVYYLNQWNIIATFLSYYIAILGSYLFYRILKRNGYL